MIPLPEWSAYTLFEIMYNPESQLANKRQKAPANLMARADTARSGRTIPSDLSGTSLTNTASNAIPHWSLQMVFLEHRAHHDEAIRDLIS